MDKNSQNVSFKETIISSFKTNIRQYTMIIALVSIWLIFTFLTEFLFLTPRNLSNLFLQTATTIILAIGMVLVIVTGNIDLSVGSVVGFTGAVSALLMIKFNMPVVPAIILTLILGLAIGAWHGFWIAYRKVPAFIVTLASQLAFRGAIIGLTGGQTQGLEMAPPASEAVFKVIGQSYLPKINPDLPFHDTTLYLAIFTIIIYIIIEIRNRFSRIKYGLSVLPMNLQFFKIIGVSIVIAALFGILISYLGFPFPVLIAIILAIIMSFVANNTSFGRHLYAIGGNAEAAKLSGININFKIFLLFVVMGFLNSVAGIVYTARLNAATLGAGQNMEMDAIASAVIGGTSLLGGEGSIFGAVIGSLVMMSIDNGMSIMNLDITYQYVVKGLVLLLAVWVDMATRNRSS